jgi:hypothetical protein
MLTCVWRHEYAGDGSDGQVVRHMAARFITKVKGIHYM